MRPQAYRGADLPSPAVDALTRLLLQGEKQRIGGTYGEHHSQILPSSSFFISSGLVSQFWDGLRKYMDIFLLGARLDVGDGADTKFWLARLFSHGRACS